MYRAFGQHVAGVGEARAQDDIASNRAFGQHVADGADVAVLFWTVSGGAAPMPAIKGAGPAGVPVYGCSAHI